MSTLVLPQSMVADRDAGIKANAQHVDDNFNALASAVNGKLDLDGTSTPTADITLGNHKITNVATPTLSGDAATKGYVDSELTSYSNRNLTFSGTVNATTQSTTDNSTKIATTEFVTNVLDAIYPVDSIYIGTQNTCPLATLIPGSTWEKIEGRYLLASGTLAGTSETYLAKNTVAAGLPDHNHTYTRWQSPYAFDPGGYGGLTASSIQTTSNASASNPIYGASATVRAPAYVVNVWRRTA